MFKKEKKGRPASRVRRGRSQEEGEGPPVPHGSEVASMAPSVRGIGVEDGESATLRSVSPEPPGVGAGVKLSVLEEGAETPRPAWMDDGDRTASRPASRRPVPLEATSCSGKTGNQRAV